MFGIFLALYFAVAVLSETSRHAALDSYACQREEMFRQAHRLYRKSGQILCHEECPCYIEDPSIYPDALTETLKISDNPSDPTSILQCP